MKNEAKNKDDEEWRTKWTAESEVGEEEDNGRGKMREGREKDRRSNAGWQTNEHFTQNGDYKRKSLTNCELPNEKNSVAK